MKLTVCLLFSIISIFASCNGQTSDPTDHPVFFKEMNVKGDTVKELGSSIMVIYQDRKNNYWFGSWKTGVYRYDGKTLVNFTTKHGLYSDRVDDIKEDSSGNIYFAGMNQNATITKFDGSSFTTIKATPSNEWRLDANDLWLLNPHQDKQKVYRFDRHTLYELTLPKPAQLNNAFEIYSIYKDRKGNIWFGTNPVGVCRYDGSSFEWITEEDVTEFRDGGSNGVRSITEDKNGDFWFNTENRYSIYDSVTLKSDKFYTRHQSIGNLDGKAGSVLNEYLSITKDDNDDLWMATYNAGVWKYDGAKISHYPVLLNYRAINLFSIYKDNKGDLWLGTQENGALKFDGRTFVPFVP